MGLERVKSFGGRLGPRGGQDHNPNHALRRGRLTPPVKAEPVGQTEKGDIVSKKYSLAFFKLKKSLEKDVRIFWSLAISQEFAHSTLSTFDLTKRITEETNSKGVRTKH